MRPHFRNRNFGPGAHREFGPQGDFDPRQRFGHRPGGPRDPFADPEALRAMLGRFGRGHRARPGNLRNAILALLAEGSLNGYGIIQAVSERSGGLWQPSSGAVYPALQLLEDEGLIAPAEGGSSKRAYALTEAGQTYVQEHAAELKDPWKTSDEGEGLHALLGELRSLMGAARQVAQVGTPAQRQAAQETLSTARKALYKLLAED